MANDGPRAAAPEQAPVRHQETEVKLDLAPGATLDGMPVEGPLAAAGIASVTEPQTLHLEAVYYDTAGLDLLRSRVTLRRRHGGKDDGWHLKLPGPDVSRTEVALPLDAGRPGSVPPQFATVLRGTARGRALVPVARLATTRTVRVLRGEDGTPMVEIADDQVRAWPRLPDGPTAGRWHEAEAELLEGDVRQLRAAVRALREAGASPSPSASKLARALDLSTPPDPDRRTAGGVIVGAIARHRDTLIAVDRDLREHGEEAIHDARATARRIRSLLRVYGPLFTTDADLYQRLRELGAVLGPARDLEVLRERLLAELAEDPAGSVAAAQARLTEVLDVRTGRARSQAENAINSEQYLTLLRDLDAFVAQPPLAPVATGAADKVLAGLLGRASAKLRHRISRALANTQDEEIVHGARKAAKTLRYAAEAAKPVLGSAATRRIAAAERIQETLGAYHDAAVAAEFVQRLAANPKTTGEMGFAFGRLHAMEDQRTAAMLERFTTTWGGLSDRKLRRRLDG